MTEPDPSWPRRAWDLGLLHKGGDPHHCPACLKRPEPPKDFICPGDNSEVLAHPQPASEVAQQDAPQSATTCICQHTKQQHFEDACLVCDCGDYLEPEAAREVIARWRQIALRARADRAATLTEAADALDRLTQETAAADMTMPEGRWRAGLDAGIRELRRLAAEAVGPEVHVYLSTGCWHGDHVYCKNMTGLNGVKRPGECKHCGAKCICLCHAGTASRPGIHSMNSGQPYEDLGDDHSCAESNCTGEPTTPVLSEEICPGFPDRCPNLRTVEPERGVHVGGVRCGCADVAPAVYPQVLLGAAELEEKLELNITPLTDDAFIADKGVEVRAEIVHDCPLDGSGLTSCCGRAPFELPLGDRISSEAPVTCSGSTDERA